MAPALPHKGDAMILLHSVLVATDFGETSRQALKYGRNLARAFGGTLHLLHVVDSVVLARRRVYPHGPRDVEANSSRRRRTVSSGRPLGAAAPQPHVRGVPRRQIQDRYLASLRAGAGSSPK